MAIFRDAPRRMGGGAEITSQEEGRKGKGGKGRTGGKDEREGHREGGIDKTQVAKS